MTLKVHQFLAHPQWRAAQFACYMLLTIMGGIVCAWYTGGQRPVAVPLIAVLTALMAAIFFRPGGVISLAAMLGILLGGAIFQVFSKRRDSATNSA
jgi:CHASE2 domain-containing sensor protein